MVEQKQEFPTGTPSGSSRSAIGQRIKSAISDANYSQLDASVALETPISTLRNWIQGRSEPTASALGAISDLTGRSVDWLVKGTEDRSALASSTNKDHFLDPDVVRREAEFILDAFSTLEEQLTPAGTAIALVDRVRKRMRLMREDEEHEGAQNDKMRA